jgi:hypothetical protein
MTAGGSLASASNFQVTFGDLECSVQSLVLQLQNKASFFL